MSGFGDLLRQYRLRCRDPQNGAPLTQARLAELLSLGSAIEGYSGATISNWERGKNQIRRDDRHILISLLKALFTSDGFHTAEEADHLLVTGNYRPLDEGERQQINPVWKQKHTSKEGGATFLSAEEQEGMLPPATYSQLFGLEEAQRLLLPLLLSPKSPFLLMVVGMGGSGKTALVDALARQVIHIGHFDRVIWLLAETLQGAYQVQQTTVSLFRSVIEVLGQHLLAGKPLDHNLTRRQLQIRSALKQQRCLVIMDNLEDPAETNWLLGQLQGLVGPSKFLLTARHHPAPEAEAYVFPIPQLSLTKSVTFLRYQAQLSGIDALMTVTDDELALVHQTIGGHPQALRLVVRLTRMYPLAQVLSWWAEGQAGYIAQMYQTIYAAIWQALVPAEKQLLWAMLLVAQVGATADQLPSISNLSRNQFWPALTRLIELCLIEPRRTSPQQRYGIHSLTTHFLYSQWEPEGITQDSVFGQNLLAALAYWNQFLGQLSHKQWAVLETDLPNLFLAVQFSLMLNVETIVSALQENWLSITERLLPFFEQRGFSSDWLPLLEKIVERFEHEPRPQCQLLNHLGKLYRLSQQYPQAIATHHRVEQIVRHSEDNAEMSQTYLNLGTDYFRVHDYDRARHYAQNALDLFMRLSASGRGAAAALNLLGNIARAEKELSLSEQYLQQAMAIWRDLGLAPEFARTCNNLALTWQQQGKITEALTCYHEAKIALTRTASELDRILIHLSEGTLYFNLARYDEAEAAFRRINLSFLQKSGHRLYQAFALNNLGNIAFMRQAFGQAQSSLSESVTIWREICDEPELANTLSRLGDTYVAQNQDDAAILCFEEVLTLTSHLPADNRARQLFEDAQEQLQKLSPLKQKKANQEPG